MKKILSMLLVMVMVFSLFAFAVEEDNETVIENDTTAAETTGSNEDNAVDLVNDDETSHNHDEEQEEVYVKAKVLEAGEVGEKEYKMNYLGQEMKINVIGQDVKLLVKSGKYKGTEISIMQPLGEQGAEEYETPLKVGQKVYITVSKTSAEDGTVTYDAQIALPISQARENVIYITIAVLVLLVILLAREKSIRSIGIVLLNIVVLFIAFGILYLKAIPALVTLAIVSIVIIVTNILIINKLSKKSLVAILSVLVATILTVSLAMFMINITDISDAFKVGTYEEGEAAKPEYIDIIIATMVIASIGMAINVAINTVKEYMKGEKVLAIMKTVSSKLTKFLNPVLLIAIGTILTNVFYIKLQKYPMHMIFFGDNNAFMELIKILVIMVNPIIVIPITTVLSKLLLEPTKEIDEAK